MFKIRKVRDDKSKDYHLSVMPKFLSRVISTTALLASNRKTQTGLSLPGKPYPETKGQSLACPLQNTSLFEYPHLEIILSDFQSFKFKI